MTSKSLHCVVDIDLSCVTCPGVWLPRREEIYISVCFLGQYRRTCLVSPTFPLIFRENLSFEKTFYDVYDPSQVCQMLDGQHVLIELIQISPYYEEGVLLAFYEASAKNFMYPSRIDDENGINRYILLQKTTDFPANGVSPRLEFRTFTVIKDPEIRSFSATARSRNSHSARGYEKPTFSSAIRAMEVAQSLERKPTFATRKVRDTLIGRVPGAGPTHSFLKSKRSKRGSSSPLSPYGQYSDIPVAPEVKPNVSKFSKSYPSRSRSASNLYQWEPCPLAGSLPPWEYDNIDRLAHDLEMARLRF